MRVEKLTTPERKRELDKISSIAFTYPMRDPDPKEQTATNAEEQQRNIEEFAMVDETNDKLMGGMILLDYQTRIGDKWLPLTGIGGVATLPEYRRAGVIRGIFKHILPRMYENGIAISGLYPFSHAFYRKFGYEVTSGISTASVGLDQLRAFPMPDEVRQIDNQRDELLARGVYEKFAEKRDISMRREISAYWKWLLSADIYKERAYRYLLMRRVGDAMEPCAYISFTPDNQPDVGNIVAAREAAYVDMDGLKRLLGFAATFYPHYKRLSMTLPGDVDLGAICTNSYDVKVKTSYDYMLRAVNARVMLESQPLSPALKALAGIKPLSFSLALTDEMIPQNTGRYDVTITGEGVKCAQSEYGDADMSMNINTFSQLTTGSISLSEAYARDDFEMNAPCPAAEMLFLRRPQYIVDHY